MKYVLAQIVSFFFLFPYRFNSRVQIGKGVIANHKLKIKGPGQVIIHDGVNLWSHAEPTQILTFSPEATVELGSKTRLNGTTIQARKSIKIGQDCLVASAIIMDNDFHNPDPVFRFNNKKIPAKAIEIGNRVWIAGQCIILKGVTIGDNSVLGIRSVLTKSMPPNVVFAGNPAKKIKDLPF